MQNVIYSNGLENLAPPQALSSLADLLNMDRGHLMGYFPELEGYHSGRVNILPIENGNFRIVGDLATAPESLQYFSPTTVRFYSDRAQGIAESPRIVELPQKINVMLERQLDEQPVYLVRDYFRAPEMSQEMPAGVVRGVIKDAPSEEEMFSTYGTFQDRIAQEPAYESQVLGALDTMSYQPHYMQPQAAQYMVAYPEFHGYQPAQLTNMSRALQARNPLYLRNTALANRSSGITFEQVVRVALWIAVGIFLGVVIGLYVVKK